MFKIAGAFPVIAMMCVVVTLVPKATMAGEVVKEAKHGESLNPSEYTIVKRERKPSSYAEQDPTAESWVTEVVLKEPPAHIPVMQEDSYWWAGALLDPDSEKGIKCEWLEKGKILWIQWDTKSTGGSGVWSKQGHIIALVKDGEAKVLLVNAMQKYVQFGVDCVHEGQMYFLPEERDKQGRSRISRHFTTSDSLIESTQTDGNTPTLEGSDSRCDRRRCDSGLEITTELTVTEKGLLATGHHADASVCKSWEDCPDKEAPKVTVEDVIDVLSCGGLNKTVRTELKTALLRENQDIEKGKELNCARLGVSCRCSLDLIEPDEAGYIWPVPNVATTPEPGKPTDR